MIYNQKGLLYFRQIKFIYVFFVLLEWLYHGRRDERVK